MVRVDTLTEDPNNERDHSAKNYEAIAGSLDEFGQQTPIAVTAKGVVVKGNGTLVAVREILKWTHIARVVIDITDPVAVRAYGITDNRTGELATWKLQPLQASLLSVRDGGFDLGKLGWDDHDLQPILAATWTKPELSNEPLVDYETIKLTTEQFAIVKGAACKDNDQPIELALVEFIRRHTSDSCGEPEAGAP